MILSKSDQEEQVDNGYAGDSLGGRIVEAREALGLSTAQFARRAGVLSETLRAWETDRLIPRTNQLIKIAGMMNVSPTWLLFERGESPSDDSASAELANMQESVSRLRGQLLNVVDGLERLEKRIEQTTRYDESSP